MCSAITSSSTQAYGGDPAENAGVAGVDFRDMLARSVGLKKYRATRPGARGNISGALPADLPIGFGAAEAVRGVMMC